MAAASGTEPLAGPTSLKLRRDTRLRLKQSSLRRSTAGAKASGPRRDRTADLGIANAARSQLSYGPILISETVTTILHAGDKCKPLWLAPKSMKLR